MKYEAKQEEKKYQEKVKRQKERERSRNKIKARDKVYTKHGEGIVLSSDDEHDSDYEEETGPVTIEFIEERMGRLQHKLNEMTDSGIDAFNNDSNETNEARISANDMRKILDKLYKIRPRKKIFRSNTIGINTDFKNTNMFSSLIKLKTKGG